MTPLNGAVGAAWTGDPRLADGQINQIYVVFSPPPQVNARYTVLGQVISRMDVVERRRVNEYSPATVKEIAAK